MIKAVRTILFDDRASATRKHLESLVSRDDVSKIGKVSEIKSSGRLEKGYTVSDDESILTLSKGGFDELLHLTTPANKDGGENHLEEKQDYYIDFTPYENHIYKALNNVRNFLKRALGRTTGMFSRVLKLVIDSVGYQFDKGTPEAVFSKIEKDTFNNPAFIRDFSKYFFKSNNISSSSATVDIPEPDFQKNKLKNNFASFTLKTMNFFGKLPDIVVNYFPLAFCFQNVAMPWLAKACPEGGLGRFFNFMRMVNPWLDEFVSSVMGVFKQEILDTKDTLQEINNDASGGNKTDKFSESKANNGQESEEVNLIQLSSLSKEQYSLKHTMDDLNSALTRLIGKKNNISSLILYGILKFYGFDGYPDFANKTFNRPDFIQKLHECLLEGKVNGEENNSPKMSLINAKIDEKFKDSNIDRQAAKAAVALITLSHGIKEDYVTNYPRFFGKIYSWQYLFMPIVTRLIGNKGFIGKTLNFIADINPLLNDFCFDPLATFQEEILGMKEKSKSIHNLLPKMPDLKLSSTLTSIVNSGRALIDAVYSFGRGLYEKATTNNPQEPPVGLPLNIDFKNPV